MFDSIVDMAVLGLIPEGIDEDIIAWSIWRASSISVLRNGMMLIARLARLIVSLKLPVR